MAGRMVAVAVDKEAAAVSVADVKQAASTVRDLYHTSYRSVYHPGYILHNKDSAYFALPLVPCIVTFIAVVYHIPGGEQVILTLLDNCLYQLRI
jgi:hypothetical protein